MTRTIDIEPTVATRPILGALACLALSMALTTLSASIVAVALPALADAFSAPFQAVQWIFLAYLLAITTLIVSVGRLGDSLGRRNLLLAGLIVFTAASTLCGLAPSLPILVAARAAQGLGAAVMMALTMAFVGETVPKERTGSAMGLLATMSAIGTALGPTLGGILIAGFGWLAVFLVNVPLGLLAFGLGWLFLPADKARPKAGRGRFDVPGTVLLAGTLAAYSLATTIGHGRFGPLNAALLAATAAGAGLFILTEAKVAAPLVRLSAFRDPGFSAGLAMNVIAFAVIATTMVVGPFYLSRSLGLDEAAVGFVMSVGPASGALSGVVAGRIVDRFGAPAMAVAGLAGMAAGARALSALPPVLGIGGYIAGIVVLVPGYILFQSANNTAMMIDVPADRRGLMSGLVNLSRNLGLMTGASVMGAVFAFAAGTSDFAAAAPEAVAFGLRMTFAVAAGLVGIAAAIAILTSRSSSAARMPQPARRPD